MCCHNKSVCFVHCSDSLVFKFTLKMVLNQVSIQLWFPTINSWRDAVNLYKPIVTCSDPSSPLCFHRHTWQVQDKPMANNVAYTSGRLSLHTDYPALHHPPGVSSLSLSLSHTPHTVYCAELLITSIYAFFLDHERTSLYFCGF